MAVDLGVFQRQVSLLDRQKLQEEFELKKQLGQAQLAQAGAQLAKAQYLDVDKLGEQSLFKAAQGLELSPQEQAAARFVSAKTEKVQFDPVTGSRIDTPSLANRLGVNIGGGQPMQQPMMQPQQAPQQESPPQMGNLVADPFSGGGSNLPPAMNVGSLPNVNQPQQFVNQYEQRYNQAMADAANNPKLQQQIKADYLKSTLAPNESEAKNAGYAQRMVFSDPIISDPKNISAATDPKQVARANIPLIGNFLKSDEYQASEQAQRDFLAAILRRESGASIAPTELTEGRKQYFPQPGDSELVLQQKAANRQTALGGVELSAGPSYARSQPVTPTKENLQQSFDKKKDAIQIVEPTRAPDGHMYISDPNRPGKFLRVD